ncbi:MAG: glycosyltransferase family 2 protein [Patescibacteria group bacterium]|nr:glycosyltransferase family 2 protein [Patescibacteria group bacterium]
MLLTIILPTFNEKENINPLLDRLFDSLRIANYNYEILFVDDSSDNTPDVIKQRISKNPNIRLIHRSKEERTGLATAFIKGFQKAKGKYICCMDSDLQHPPEVVPELLEKATGDNADIVVATRYAKGGSAEGLGSLKTLYGVYRRVVSIGMKYFTQIIFIPTRKTTDPLGGFFLFKKELLSDMVLEPRGFKILVEILMRTQHGEVSEIPYKFLVREDNESKATFAQGLEFLKHLLHIFRTVPEAGRFFKFCLVGFSGVLVNLGILSLSVEVFNVDKNTGWLTAVIVSILSNYFLNTVFTYGDKKSSSRTESLRRVTYYYIVSAVAMAFNFAVYRLGIAFGFDYRIAAAVGIIAATAINFILATKVVWKLPVKA